MKHLFIILFSLFSFITKAQIDTEFWFAAPVVDAENGNQPVYLYFSTFNQAATITVSQPANIGFKTLTYSVAPNKTLRVDMTPYLATIENAPPGAVLNKGLLISSSTYITSYYEVLGISNGYGLGNTEIFCLKGRRGLGQKFYTPFQNIWANNYYGTGGTKKVISVGSTSAIDIVATEDSTIVTVTITSYANGLLPGTTFTVNLNKGQTYSVQADSSAGEYHLSGSLVTSNKPIAVSVKDDSVLDGTNYDLIGDQLVPVNALGMEYIALKGSSLYTINGNYASDVLNMVGTIDNTKIYLNGFYMGSINAGQTLYYQTGGGASIYIQSTQPIYAFHVMGLTGQNGSVSNGAELAGALLSPLECTGSKQISFQRSTPLSEFPSVIDTVYLSVAVKTGYENYFRLVNTTNGNKLPFPYPAASAFTPVAGSGYSSGVFTYPTNIMEVGSYALINDSVDYHLGMMYGQEQHNFSYGYFSDYGSLYLGENKMLCSDSSIILDAGPDKNSYLWEPGGATTETITVKDTGTYSVTVTKGSCTYQDTVKIGIHAPIAPLFSEDSISFCANVKTAISVDTTYNNYLWQTGSAQQSIFPTTTGYYNVRVENQYGCTKTDSIYVTIKPLPIVKISDNKQDTSAFCTDSNVTLTATPVNAVPAIKSYLWQNNDSGAVYGPLPHSYPDTYWVKTTGVNGCVTSDTLFADCTPYVWIPNVFTPNNDPLHLNEVFFVVGLRPNIWTLQVFDRWGGRVYYNTEYDNNWNGHGLDDGVYYYYLHHVQNKANFKGWVEIIR